MSALRRMGESVLGLAHTRLQLFALDLQGETLRRLDLLFRLGMALAVGTLGLTVGTAALAIYLWKIAGYAGLLILAGALVGLAAVWVTRLRREVLRSPPPFAETLAEFERDRACLLGKG